MLNKPKTLTVLHSVQSTSKEMKMTSSMSSTGFVVSTRELKEPLAPYGDLVA